MKIGVSGASGHLGRAVVSELLQRAGGHEVMAITRTPETVSGSAQRRLGDYNRPETLAKAYAGLDRLLIITTVDPGRAASDRHGAGLLSLRAVTWRQPPQES
jgi:NAD(P)H dehydrogenase (quinone)